MDLAKDSSLCGALCTEGMNCCDDHANCYCGSRSGRYECVCNAGYHGRGHRRECHSKLTLTGFNISSIILGRNNCHWSGIVYTRIIESLI